MRIPSRFTPAALALLAACAFPSCEGLKTKRTITKVESRGASQTDPLARRFVGQSLDRWADGERHAMDHQRIDTKDLFGGTRDNKQFGGDSYNKKSFNGNTRFRGNKQYTPQGYQFVRDREMARKEALAASQKFGERDKVANEGRKSWFGRDKTVARDRADAEGQRYDTAALPGTTGAARDHNETPLNVYQMPGRGGGANQLSLEDLQDLLGRGEVNRTSVVPLER